MISISLGLECVGRANFLIHTLRRWHLRCRRRRALCGTWEKVLVVSDRRVEKCRRCTHWSEQAEEKMGKIRRKRMGRVLCLNVV